MANGLAALGLTVNALAWGVSWWPFRQLQEMGVHPLWATALVYLAGLVLLALYRPSAWRWFIHHPELWALVFGSGLANVGFNWAVTVGDVVRVVLLFYLMPAWSVLLAWPLLGERPNAAALARLGLALAGVVVVLKAPGTAWPWPQALADWLALAGGFGFALTNVMLRKLHHAPPLASMLAMFVGGSSMAAVAAVMGLQQGLVSALPGLDSAWPLWVLALSLALLAGNVGLQYGAARMSANATSIIMLSEVVFASASSVLLGAAELGTRTLIGGAMILLAAVLSASAHQTTPEPA